MQHGTCQPLNRWYRCLTRSQGLAKGIIAQLLSPSDHVGSVLNRDSNIADIRASCIPTGRGMAFGFFVENDTRFPLLPKRNGFVAMSPCQRKTKLF